MVSRALQGRATTIFSLFNGVGVVEEKYEDFARAGFGGAYRGLAVSHARRLVGH